MRVLETFTEYFTSLDGKGQGEVVATLMLLMEGPATGLEQVKEEATSGRAVSCCSGGSSNEVKRNPALLVRGLW